MSDVFIIGAGIHPFGRTPGRSGLQQGAFAVRAALAEAGLAWEDVQFAYGGSDAAGKADTMVSELGADGAAIHQRRERLRNWRLGDVRCLYDGEVGRVRFGHRGWFRQTSARRIRPQACRMGPARMVW